MNREEKARIIEDIREKADKACIAVVTDFKGMSVEEMTDLRRVLRSSNVEYQVVKNTLARIAFEETQHEGVKDKFKECCAIAFGYDDPVVAAKILVDFEKKSKKFQARFASLDGKYLEASSLKDLSELPGREELLARTLGTMNAVPTNFVSLFANLIRGMMNALNGIKEQKEEQ
ncbi:50S ribosomal protein L10 [Desulfonatronovibrio hydrogenovorans]|uniref:50S ribosomal protein L10 n=1 Tax=Desulfonatronovibrio hydrogenovorans TaxID=53245 RepID=UPI0004918058|nr:50S ribosomal protein L10 [Desulfonatronovibrio hydrogenovorans]